MAPPQKPETFMLSSEAQQSLPQDAQVALQQVDNRKPSYHKQYQDATLTIVSEILFNICSRRLDAGPIYSTISFTYRRIRFLCLMVR
jgi:hypothetical protein